MLFLLFPFSHLNSMNEAENPQKYNNLFNSWKFLYFTWSTFRTKKAFLSFVEVHFYVCSPKYVFLFASETWSVPIYA